MKRFKVNGNLGQTSYQLTLKLGALRDRICRRYDSRLAIAVWNLAEMSHTDNLMPIVQGEEDISEGWIERYDLHYNAINSYNVTTEGVPRFTGGIGNLEEPLKPPSALPHP